MSSDFKIITVCNRFPQEPYYCLNEFIKSLGEHEPLVLGTKVGEYTGLGDKPKLLFKAIKEGLIKEKYIIFCDCWDLIFANDPANLLNNAYLGIFNSPLVISSEKNCFPATLKSEYDTLPYTSSYRYLNSGMIVGETEAMLCVLEAMDLPNVPDDYRNEDGSMTHINDQELYQQIFLKQPVKIELDYNQILCNTLHSVQLSDLNFTGRFIENIETSFWPNSFHMNGSAKTDGLREPILKHLNLL